MIRSVVGPVVRPVVSLIGDVRRRGGATFNPATLFAAGEQGGWYDPSDMSTLFQDIAGTIPVTASGQSVGRMLDKSGRGNHMIGASGAFPTYFIDESGLPCLLANGISQRMYTESGVPLNTTDKLTCSVSVRVIGTGNQAAISNDSVGTARFNILYLSGASPRPRAGIDAGVGAQITVAAKGAAPYTVVNTMVIDVAGATASDEIVLRQDGIVPVQTVAAAGPAGAGNFSSQPLALFSGSASVSLFPFNGRMYGAIVRTGISSGQSLIDIESYLGEKAGLFF